MALTINTNLSSMIAQSNLNKATTALNSAIKRMTTGYKINQAADNAAGYSIATNWNTQLGSLDIAADNAATGSDMLTTLEDTYSLLSSHLQRVRDLTEQAANGTYGTSSLRAIKSEIQARFDEIDRISKNAEFNGIKLMQGGVGAEGIDIQVGLYGKTASSGNSQINIAASIFAKATVTALVTSFTSSSDFAKACAGLDADKKASDQLTVLDTAINEISSRVTTIGAANNRLDSAAESIRVQNENITSSLSTLRDADIAEESSNYIKAQILQQAAATLLATANQAPSIALNLI